MKDTEQTDIHILQTLEGFYSERQTHLKGISTDCNRITQSWSHNFPFGYCCSNSTWTVRESRGQLEMLHVLFHWIFLVCLLQALRSSYPQSLRFGKEHARWADVDVWKLEQGHVLSKNPVLIKLVNHRIFLLVVLAEWASPVLVCAVGCVSRKVIIVSPPSLQLRMDSCLCLVSVQSLQGLETLLI